MPVAESWPASLQGAETGLQYYCVTRETTNHGKVAPGESINSRYSVLEYVASLCGHSSSAARSPSGAWVKFVGYITGINIYHLA